MTKKLNDLYFKTKRNYKKNYGKETVKNKYARLVLSSFFKKSCDNNIKQNIIKDKHQNKKSAGKADFLFSIKLIHGVR